MNYEIENTIDGWERAYIDLPKIEDSEIFINIIVKDENIENLINLFYIYKYSKNAANHKGYEIDIVDINNRNKIMGMISTLFNVLDNDFKYKVSFKDSSYKLFKSTDFNKISPMFYLQDSENFLLSLNYNQLTKNTSKTIKKIIQYIDNTLKKLEDDNKYKDFNDIIEKSQSHDMLLTTLIISYLIRNNDDIKINYFNDIIFEIRRLSYGIYQLLDNCNAHSINKASTIFLRFVEMSDINEKNYKQSYEDYKDNQIKKMKYCNEYGFFLNDNNYLFICIQDCNYDFNNNKINSFKDVINNKLDYPDGLVGYFESVISNKLIKGVSRVSSNYGIKIFLNACQNLEAQLRVHSNEELINFNVALNKKIYENEKTKINRYITGYDILIPSLPYKSKDVQLTKYDTDIVKDYDTYELLNVEIPKFNDSFDFAKNGKNSIKERVSNYIGKNINGKHVYSFDFSNSKINEIEEVLKGLFNSIYYCIDKKIENDFFVELVFSSVSNVSIRSQIYCAMQLLQIFTYKISDKKEIDRVGNRFHCAFFEYDCNNKKNYITSIVSLNWKIITQSFFDNFAYNSFLLEKNRFDLLIDHYNETENGNVKNSNYRFFPFEIYNNNLDSFKEKLYSFINDTDNKIHRENVNIRLKSDIYIDNFYEVELVLQNDFIRRNMSLLIFNDLKQNVRDFKNTVIIGYENYSIKLCDDLKNNIDSANELNIKIITYSKESINSDFDTAIILIPITSTFRTLLSIIIKYNLFEKNIIVYSLFNVSPKDRIDSTFVKRFWEINKKDVFTNIELKCKIDNLSIKNYLFLDSNWFIENNKPFTTVDDSSTLPGGIVINPDGHSNTKIDSSFNNRVKLLYGNIYYGHIKAYNNHYNFYFNYYEIFKKTEYLEEVKKWLDSIEIDYNSYNVIISPLYEDNTPFLRSITNYLFKNNVVLLQFKMIETKKDNFKNKYFSIAQNIKEFIDKFSSIKVNFYFVDTTISTASTFNRAKELLNYLLTFDGKSYFYNFSKIFLFLNRLSQNTMNTLISNDNNSEFCSFLSLYVPTFDTIYGKCPDCKIEENYKTIKSLNADIETNKYLDECIKKHRVINANEIIWKELDNQDAAMDRLLLVHFFNRDKNYINKNLNEDGCDICSFYDTLIKKYHEEIKVLIPNISLIEIKKMYVKIMTRPLINGYDQIFNKFYNYMIYQLNNEIEQCESQEYKELLIERLAYSGTGYLKDNEDKIRANHRNRQKIEKSLIWEDAFKNGVI